MFCSRKKDFFDLAVPVFHSYEHNTDHMPSNFYVIMTKCLNSLVYLQLSFSPCFCGGFGMADGEGCEDY